MNRISYACILLGLALLSGCTTYKTYKVDNGGTPGFPFVFERTVKATVTYADGTQSVHITKIRDLYSVDIKGSVLGTTNATVENSDSNFPKIGKGEIDHKLPETLGAVNEILSTLGVKAATGGAAAAALPVGSFEPHLKTTSDVVNIDFSPIL